MPQAREGQPSTVLSTVDGSTFDGRWVIGVRVTELRPGAVEKHVSSIFGKLDLPASNDDHRRVLAVLAFLRAGG